MLGKDPRFSLNHDLFFVNYCQYMFSVSNAAAVSTFSEHLEPKIKKSVYQREAKELNIMIRCDPQVIFNVRAI